MTAVPTPTCRIDGFLRRIALSLTIVIVGVAAPARGGLAASETRRTAIVEAVDKIGRAHV